MLLSGPLPPALARADVKGERRSIEKQKENQKKGKINSQFNAPWIMSSSESPVAEEPVAVFKKVVRKASGAPVRRASSSGDDDVDPIAIPKAKEATSVLQSNTNVAVQAKQRTEKDPPPPESKF
jgi:hypothetical protein